AREQIERAKARVDGAHAPAEIAVDAVEMQVALEHAGTALHVHPERLPACDLRALRREEPRDQTGADLAAMDVGPMEPSRVVPRRLEIRGLETDERAELSGMSDRQVEH